MHNFLDYLKKRKLKFAAAIFIIFTGAVAYSFLWGRLFPLSPIVSGFEHKDFERAIIYYDKGVDIAKYGMIDKIIGEVEDFHKLKFNWKAEIFVFDSDEKYTRLTGHHARFVATPFYGRLFVAGRSHREALEGKIHLDVYLKHELSHSLLYQNMSLYRSQYYPGWLMEGTAVYGSNQMGVDGYLSKEETLGKIKAGYFLDPDEWSTSLLKPEGKKVETFPLPNKFWFIYSEFACIVGDLIQIYGKEKYLQYIKAPLTEDDAHTSFRRIFGIGFDEYINDFKKRSGYSKNGG